MAKLSPIYVDAQFINAIPATGAKVFTYAAGSSTKQATYTDITGLTPQANPIVLNSRGEPASPIWLTEGLSYKFVFAPSTDSDPPVSPIRTIDNVTGVNDSSITIDQWVVSGITPTYVSATQFTLPGDQTSAFQIGRRIKATVTAGTVYGTISASAFAALTTVTLTMDTGQVLDSGLSAVSYGLITTTPNSLPYSLSASAIQNQQYTAYTTAGTSSAFTLTPTPAITANTASQLFFVKFNAAPTGLPTLAVSGQAALNLKYYDSTGTKQFVTSSVIPINWQSDVYNDGTDWVVLDTLPATQSGRLLGTVYYTVPSQALTSISNATPAVITVTNARLLPSNFSPIQFTTSGTLPTGLSLLTTYYTFNSSGTTFNVATSMANAIAGTAVATSSAGSGTHTMASAPYVKATGVFGVATTLEIEVLGAGGGSGGSTSTAGSSAAGGGAGGWGFRRLATTALGASETLTVGDGGTAGANTGTNGGTGGTSSFGAFVSCTGGAGGTGSTANAAKAGAAGGTATGGDVNFSGQASFGVWGTVVVSPLGGIGHPNAGNDVISISTATYAPANAPKNSGNGANGAMGNGTAQTGAIGGSGMIIVREYS